MKNNLSYLDINPFGFLLTIIDPYALIDRNLVDAFRIDINILAGLY
jgi:hypothetical protein